MEKLRFTQWENGNREDGVGGIRLFREDPSHFLEIHFEGNLDLYFTLHKLECGTTFLIGKDNYEVYQIFDELYKSVLNGYEYKITDQELKSLRWECEAFDGDYSIELKKLIKRREEMRKLNLRIAKDQGLIEEDKIIWRSDDFPKDIAPYFVIHKLSNAYQLEFVLPEVDRKLNFEESGLILDYKYKNWINVRLRNSGSRYEPFNGAFMRAFNKLRNLDSEYHQIDIEECMIDKEMDSGVSLERILRK